MHSRGNIIHNIEHEEQKLVTDDDVSKTNNKLQKCVRGLRI